jgi:hypothetical protein
MGDAAERCPSIVGRLAMCDAIVEFDKGRECELPPQSIINMHCKSNDLKIFNKNIKYRRIFSNRQSSSPSGPCDPREAIDATPDGRGDKLLIFTES